MSARKRRATPDWHYGFRWDQVDVTRVAEIDGQKCIEVATDYGSVTIYVSKGGKSIRVFRNNEQELTR